MQYPLNLTFEIVAAAPQLSIRDAAGEPVYFAEQEALRIKDEVAIYADASVKRALFRIKAGQIIDIGALYSITDADGIEVGAVEHCGVRAIWRAHYRIYSGSTASMTVEEENPLTKAIDWLLGLLPLAGPVLSGYLFHPSYVVYLISKEQVVMHLKKRPTLFQRRFTIEKVAELENADETLAILSLLMIAMLERWRG